MKDGRPLANTCFNHGTVKKVPYKIVTETTRVDGKKTVRKLAWCPECKVQVQLMT